mmetsp:Transcript_89164/g.147615  ORF Transcript_89164/g.147615 Transcript_89164/m.147615 type:complete len:403 (-) Transcript_89164:114-1322(-)
MATNNSQAEVAMAVPPASPSSEHSAVCEVGKIENELSGIFMLLMLTAGMAALARRLSERRPSPDGKAQTRYLGVDEELSDHMLESVTPFESCSNGDGHAKAYRSVFLDALRGNFLGFMIIYHFSFDLTMMQLHSLRFSPDATWKEEGLSYAVYVTVCCLLFMTIAPLSKYWGAIIFCAGGWFSVEIWPHMTSNVGAGGFCFVIGCASALNLENCLTVSDSRRSGIQRFLKSSLRRLFILAMAACVVTVATYFVDSDEYITFGALHMICVVSLLHLPFLYVPRCALLMAIFLVILRMMSLEPEPEMKIGNVPGTWDYQPVLPNLAAVLFGVFAHSIGYHRLESLPSVLRLCWAEAPLYYVSECGLFAFLGRHAVAFYLLHQVAFYPVSVAMAELCGTISVSVE